MLLKGVYLLPTPEQDRFTTFRFPTTISRLAAGLDFSALVKNPPQPADHRAAALHVAAGEDTKQA